MKKRNFYKIHQSYDYKATTEECISCRLRGRYTKPKAGRTLKRHIKQNKLGMMHNQAKARAAKHDLITRKHLMERSFARSIRYGFKRARRRRQWRVEIHEYLTSIIQNIMTLIRNTKDEKFTAAMYFGVDRFIKAQIKSEFNLCLG
ncbi:MAG: transposase [Desulfobacterales bacterium]|nr:transposase [Desulfobacterales bacterium]